MSLLPAIAYAAFLAVAAESWLMLRQNRRRWRLLTLARLLARAYMLACLALFTVTPPLTARGYITIAAILAVALIDAMSNFARRKAGTIVQSRPSE